MKAALFALLALTQPALSFAQTSFQKSLDVFLEAPRICVAPDGNTCYVADAFTLNSVNRVFVYQMDAAGNILWRREQVGTDANLRLQSMQALENGVLLVLSSVNVDQSNGFLMKFNADGSVAWDRRIGKKNFTQLFDIQEDNEENLWLSGLHLGTNTVDTAYHFLSRLDGNGIPETSRQNQFRYFSHTGYESCRFTDLCWNTSNQSLLFVEDFENLYSHSAISSPNRGRSCLGYCDGDFALDEKFTPYKIAALENADTNLLFSGWTTFGNFVADKPFIGLLDKNGKNGKIVKRTPSVFRPIHSRSNDIIFYVPQDKMLVKYDATLTPVWSVKLDNCSATNAFQADIAADGSIFTVRNIDKKTIVAKVLPDGSLPACTTYHRTPPALTDYGLEAWVSYGPTGYPEVAVADTLHLSGFSAAVVVSKDFCVKLDASFEIPGLICEGTEIVPAAVDTMEGLRHTWDLGDFRSEDSIPVFSMQNPGTFQVFHTLENNICKDTAGRAIRVIRRPVLPFQDTLVCGPASLTFDFNNNGADRYYLNGQSIGPVIGIEQSGTYTIRLENDACFAEEDIRVKIVAFDPPVLPLDSVYCFGTPVLVPLSPDFDQYFWDHKPVPGSFAMLSGAQHMFQARYKPDTSCVVEGIYDVPRKKCNSDQYLIYAPNIFAPDVHFFQVFPTAIAQIRSIQIFNRWGSLVYQHTGETPEWDGTINGRPAAPGVYAFWIEYLDKRDESIQVQTGDVLLLR